MRLLAIATLIGIAMVLHVQPISAQATAQEESYRFDFGLGLGMSGYLGDANTGNIFRHPGFAGEASFRYLINNRWALRTQLTTASLSGNTKDLRDILPADNNTKFKSNIFALTEGVEFNFFSYGIGETYKRLRRWTPYLGLGVGALVSNTGGKTYFALCAPMTFGFRFKVKPRFNLEAAFTIAKTFSDNIDGAKDLHNIKTTLLKDTDWYSTIHIGFTYEFGPRCTVCHRID